MTNETTSEQTYKNLSVSFPYADDGELTEVLKQIIRDQEEFDLDGREFLIERVEADRDGIDADIAVRVDDE